MNSKKLTLLAVGDMIVNMPDPESKFALVAPVLKSADIVVGQGEYTFTKKPVNTAAWSGIGHPFQPEPCDPANMKALSSAGFNVIHLASNHIWDAGIPGIEDTITGFRKLGINTVGAGMNLDEARKPAVVNCDGTRFGFLSYNCVGPKETYANPLKPGCAWVHIITAYEMDHPTPGGVPAIYTFPEPESFEAMLDDVRRLRSLCDVLVVHFHKGIGMTPIKIALYEQTISHAAIDAGADLILAEHAHILKGIELYKGKAIYHGLADFIPGGFPRSQEAPTVWLIQQTERRIKESMGLERGPECPTWPMHPDVNLSIIAKCTIDEGRITKVSYLPCLINEQDQPEILKNDEGGRRIFDYMDDITRAASLNAQYEWEGNEVVIRAD